MMAKTIRQALTDEVLYPLPDGFVDNRLLARGLDGDDDASAETYVSDAFLGALADCLSAVVEQAVTFSDAGKTVNAPSAAQVEAMRQRIRRIYSYLDEDGNMPDIPGVTFGLG